jgi:uncharacterized protein YqhQ
MSEEKAARFFYGGQAVIEGVMMRGLSHMAVAVRKPNGTIITHSERLQGIYTSRARHIPILRGMLVLAETLSLGMRALSFSSRIALAETMKEDKADKDGDDEEFPSGIFWGSMIIALVFVAAVFFAGPVVLAQWLDTKIDSKLLVVFIEGIFRLTLLIGYIWGIGFMPDVRRVFMYHGAEHMTIRAYEADEPLVAEHIRKYPKEHPRCGTSFLLTVVLVAVIVFFAFDAAREPTWISRIISRVVLIPIIAAVAYEGIRLGGKYQENPFVHALFTPNLMLQKLTTRHPDDSQIEVAVKSLDTVLAAEREPVIGDEEPLPQVT